jgi:hypothetical protein
LVGAGGIWHHGEIRPSPLGFRCPYMRPPSTRLHSAALCPSTESLLPFRNR